MVFAAFGARDLRPARPAGGAPPRCGRHAAGGPGDALCRARQTVLVTGATGFIGRRLVQALTTAGHQVIVLARDPAKAATLNPPFRLITGLSQLPDDTHDRRDRQSRGRAGRERALDRRQAPPHPRLAPAHDRQCRAADQAAAAQARRAGQRLGDRLVRRCSGDETLTEAASGRPSFGASVCADWERAAVQAERFGVRVVRLRIGLVLGTEGGMLAQTC